MILFKIVQQFMLPSVFLLFFLLVGFVLTVRAPSQTIGKVVFLFAFLFLYLFSVAPVANRVIAPLERVFEPIQVEQFPKVDYVVLLLGGRESTILRASEILRLYTTRPLTVIVSGANAFNPQGTEAANARQYLVDRGIAPDHIILEGGSRTTFESAKKVKELVENNPFFLVTSGYHMPRSMEAFEALGAVPIAAPTDFKQEERYSLLDFFPSAQSLEKTDLAFHEYFGILFYRTMYY